MVIARARKYYSQSSSLYRFNGSDKYARISCHTFAEYSRTDLTLQRYTFGMSFDITPTRFSNISAYNLFAAFATTY